MSYPATKNKLTDILEKLKLTEPNPIQSSEIPMSTLRSIPIEKNDSLVIRKIKEELNDVGGKVTVTLYSGDGCDIWFDESGKGLVSPKISPAN